MLKNHPKGLLVAFFTNMGERFGFYTMMAILVYFLQARYDLNADSAGSYYSWFYFAIYALALVGGLIADWTSKYKTVILVGQIIMFAGYCLIAVPGSELWVSVTALFVIALGNGLFKGNLQAVVGQMYDNDKYRKFRDGAFMIFYMGINIGAFFAPFVAKGIKGYWLRTNGYLEDGNLPSLCHQLINGKLTNTDQLQTMANAVIIPNGGKSAADLHVFATDYINVFSTGFNYAFAIAAGAMIVSLIVYLIFNKLIPAKQKEAVAETAKKADAKSAVTLSSNLRAVFISLGLMIVVALLFHLADYFTDIKDINYQLGLAVGLFVGFVTLVFQLSTKDERPRIVALSLVFLVVIFFWMSFHQNGLTLSMFARDYTTQFVSPFTNLFFDIWSILSVIAAIAGCILLFFNKKAIVKVLGGVAFLAFGYLCYYFASNNPPQNAISPEVFQSFNPLFIVALTPLVMGIFAWMNKKGKEPSSPRKIGIGMFIAAAGFILILIASMSLIGSSPKDMAGAPVVESMRVSPYWLMSSYLILTIAELFLSPIGLSFVSKVAPPRFQGLMQGGWLLATAIGNKFLFIGSLMWGKVELYALWGIFIICCILAAIFIFSIMKRLERVTK